MSQFHMCRWQCLLTCVDCILCENVFTKGGYNPQDSQDEHVVVIPEGAMLPEKMGSHGHKKAAVNTLAENLNFQTFVFRCGWMVRNFHSAFDYIFNSTRKDLQCGKTLAGWHRLGVYGDKVLGGFPPHFKDGGDNFELFCQNLLGVHEHLSNDVRNMLVSSILRWHDVFNKLISREINGKLEDVNTHPFNDKILKALDDSGELFLYTHGNCLT